MDEFLQPFTKKENIMRMFLSGIIFMVVSIPFRLLFSLMPGITEIRPANTIPPVLGIIWGPSAALGISIGNLISDILSKSSVFVCITGFIANFFFAYLPYKMWYSVNIHGDDNLPTLNSVKKIIKYVFIIFVDSFVVTSMLSLIFESAGFVGSANSYPLLFFNNFDFAVILGVILLIFIKILNVDYCIPKKKSLKLKLKLPFNYALAASGLIGLANFIYSTLNNGKIRSEISFLLLIISIILAYIYILKPCNKNFICENKNNAGISEMQFPIKMKFIVGFLLMAIIFIIFIGIIAYNSSYDTAKALNHWIYVYRIIGIAINVVFVVAISFLYYIEKNIVDPLQILSFGAEKFANRNHLDPFLKTEPTISIKTGDEIEYLASSFNKMMIEITEYVKNLHIITVEKERISTELNIATQIQASMLPCIFPPFPDMLDFDIYALAEPAKEVGGDFYDFFLIDNNNLCLIIADVSGKGVPAALFMVITKTLIKNSAQIGNNPKKVFEIVNNQLCENNEAAMFVTAFMGILEINSGKFTYVNAGHNKPLIKKANGNFNWLNSKHGFVLAGMENSVYTEEILYLEKEDLLYMYTDGVTEAMNLDGELYSDSRLINDLNKHKNLEIKDLVLSINQGLYDFSNNAEQADDITMLILKIR